MKKDIKKLGVDDVLHDLMVVISKKDQMVNIKQNTEVFGRPLTMCTHVSH